MTRKWSTFDIVTKVSTLAIVLWTIAFFLVNVFGCGKHFDYGWGPLVEEEHCVDGLKELEALIISDFLTDLLVILLPIPIVGSKNLLVQFDILYPSLLDRPHSYRFGDST